MASEPVVIVAIWRINREVVHGQSTVSGEVAPPCSIYSLVIDNVHANPVVKCVLHAVYILSESGPWSTFGRFLSGGIILGSPLSCPDLFLYTITLPAVSCDAPPTLSYTTLELASRVLLSTKARFNRQ